MSEFCSKSLVTKLQVLTDAKSKRLMITYVLLREISQFTINTCSECCQSGMRFRVGPILSCTV